MTVLICIHICLIHPGICDQSSPYTWTQLGVTPCCRLKNLHVYWLLACPEFCSPPPTPPVLVEKAMGGVRVNIDAHSVPSQPQSIWNHSSLWRTNNLEETLIITHPFTLQNPLEASLSPLFSSSYTSPSLHLVMFFFIIHSLVIIFLYALWLAFLVCVPSHTRWIMDKHRWGTLPEMSCRYTQPSALSGMIRLFNKWFFFCFFFNLK